MTLTEHDFFAEVISILPEIPEAFRPEFLAYCRGARDLAALLKL